MRLGTNAKEWCLATNKLYGNGYGVSALYMLQQK